MRVLLFIFILFFSTKVVGQTFTQTFVDRCTGEVQVVSANFTTGSAIVAFYNEAKIFSYQQYLNGELQQWLAQKYAWWQALSPCSSATTQAQNAQNAANNATSSTSTSNSNTSSNSNEGSNNTSTGSSEETSSSSSGETDSSSSGESESSSVEEETTEEGGNTESEEESESEESTEESSEEETEEETEEEQSEEESEESDSDEEEEKKEKKKKFMPIQLKADFLQQQALTLKYNAILSIGASQTSIYGDISNTATLQVYDNLKQLGVSLGRSKVTLNQNYKVTWVDGINVSYMRNYNMNATSISLTRMKPMGKYGTVGVGINYAYMFGKDNLGERLPNMASLGYNFLYTNSIQINRRINYAPALIAAQSPISYMQKTDDIPAFGAVSKDLIGILANSFTVNITKTFSFNVGWTLIYSTNEFVPIMNSFMIGSKIPL